MSTRNFVVKNGLTVGNVTIDAASGNLVAGNANLGNLAQANFFQGDGGLLANINGANISGNISGNITNANYAAFAGNITVAAQPNITSVGTLTSLDVTGNVAAGGIKTDNLYYSNGTPWDLQQAAGANYEIQYNVDDNFAASANFTFNPTTNVLTVAGNIAGQNVDAGNLLTANFVSGTLTTSAQPNITSVGTLTSLDVTGNVAAGNVSAAEGTFTANVSSNNLSTTNSITAGNGLQVTTGALSVLAGNLDVTGNINVTGNLNYSNVTDLVVGDPLIYIGANNSGDIYDLGIVGSYNNGTYQHTGIARNAADDIWTFFDGVAAEPTTVIDWANASYPTVKMGNLITTGNANLSGNISATNGVFTNVSGNGANLSSITGANVTGEVGFAAVANSVAGANVSGQVANALVAGTVYTAAQPNITSVGTLTSLAVSGNASVGNLSTDGAVTATGNISGNYILGNGAFLTGIDATSIQNGSANVRTFANANVAISAAGNANVVVVSGAGADVTGYLAVTGNVSGNVFSGNGSGLTSLAGANVTGTVANAAYATNAGTSVLAGTVTTAAQPNITSVGTLTSLAVSGNVSAGNIDGGNLVSANYVSGTLTTAAQPNITSVGTLTSLDVTGNVSADYVKTVGYTTDRANVAVSTGTVIDQFSPSDFRTAKYVISASGDNGYQSVETLLVHDGVDAYITIYGSVCSNLAADIIDVTANINGVSGNVALYATAGGANVVVNVVASYIKT